LSSGQIPVDACAAARHAIGRRKGEQSTLSSPARWKRYFNKPTFFNETLFDFMQRS
jgi:hypothetical protein